MHRPVGNADDDDSQNGRLQEPNEYGEDSADNDVEGSPPHRQDAAPPAKRMRTGEGQLAPGPVMRGNFDQHDGNNPTTSRDIGGNYSQQGDQRGNQMAFSNYMMRQPAPVSTGASSRMGMPQVGGGVFNYPGIFLGGGQLAPGPVFPQTGSPDARTLPQFWGMQGMQGMPFPTNPLFSQAMGFNIGQGGMAGMPGVQQGSPHQQGAETTGGQKSGAGGADGARAAATSRRPTQVRGDRDDSEASVTGRGAMLLYMSCDDDSLSEYQCLVRKQIEVFEAVREDVDSNAQGRNRPIVMGQVGIRCKHCTMLPPKHRARGAVYYPARLQGLYQAAQNMASSHLCDHCQHVPDAVRAELVKLRDRKSSAGGGKKYWADGVRVIGVYEDDTGLRFEKR